MAINYTPDEITSGFNLTKLNNNFTKVDVAFQDALSRSGSTPNHMNADIDMNSHSLLNVGAVDAELLVVDGVPIQPGVELTNALKISSALSELTLAGLDDEARANLGLGSAALQPTSAFATAAQGAKADAALPLATTALQPLQAVRTSLHFGCVGDGVTDDSNAAEAMLRSGVPVFIVGTIRITRKITASTPLDGTLAVNISGSNRLGRFLLDSATAGIEIDVGEVADSGTTVEFRDIDILVNAAIPSNAALRIQASSAVGSGSLRQTCFISNVHVIPTSPTNYTISGFSFFNVRLSGIYHCSVRGRSSSIVVGSKGFDYSGNVPIIPVETTYYACRCYFYENGFEASSAWEGLKWLYCDAIGCKVGFKATSTNPNLGDSLKIICCQANTSFVGIWLEDIKNSHIEGCQLTGNSAWGTDGSAYFGLFCRTDQAAGQFSYFVRNIINGEQIKAAVSICTGLDINGFSSGNLGSFVGPNTFVGHKIGLNIGNNVRGVQFTGLDQFWACDVSVATAAVALANTRVANPVAY